MKHDWGKVDKHKLIRNLKETKSGFYHLLFDHKILFGFGVVAYYYLHSKLKHMKRLRMYENLKTCELELSLDYYRETKEIIDDALKKEYKLILPKDYEEATENLYRKYLGSI